ncbi:tRNA (adenosine(37)-N6)-dimethylallyltransferase MiaA [bacterium]|nr:MAG: tRNA (adenosine(37)-N6)-dimethylallyltransferase MiaA [bacterium]
METPNVNRKIIVIAGPTASGKSRLAIALARKFNGEIISADSRQVYKGLEIGSGVATKKEMAGISHHLIGFVSPQKTYTVAEYKKTARKEINRIWKNGRLPILVGGTGLYIRAAVDGLVIPEVKPNLKLRKELGKKTVEEMAKILKQKDPRRWAGIDRKNPRRLMRAIEIANALGRVPELKMNPIEAEVLLLGITKNKEELQNIVRKRVKGMLKRGLVRETLSLLKMGVREKKIREFGFEYADTLDFIGGRTKSSSELLENIVTDTLKYAKRQMTWFKKDQGIEWIKNEKEALDSARSFLYT